MATGSTHDVNTQMEEVDLTDIHFLPIYKDNDIQQQHKMLQSPITTEQPKFGTLPQLIVCQNCATKGLTSISYVTGKATFLSALACCFICPPLFYIPFVTTPLKDVEHSCKYCKLKLGRAKLL
eukprot:gene18996-20907_t